jgi:hypothetical protein
MHEVRPREVVPHVEAIPASPQPLVLQHPHPHPTLAAIANNDAQPPAHLRQAVVIRPINQKSRRRHGEISDTFILKA